ncbi:MAG: WD40 repeat domain-containing protein, partial [Thermogutta sp.]
LSEEEDAIVNMAMLPFRRSGLRLGWAATLGVFTALILSSLGSGQTPAILSSFHVVDVKSRTDIRPAVVTAVFYDTARDLLFTAGDDHFIRVFKQPGDQQVAILSGGGWIYSLALDPTGRYLGAVNERGFLSVWEWESKRRVYERSISSTAIRSVAFHPAGQYLAAGGFEPRIFIVEIRTGRLLVELTGDRDIRQVVFSDDGSLLAAAGGLGRVLLWDARSLQKRAEIPASSRRLHTAAFSPDGRFLIVGGDDGVVSLWRLDATPIQTVAQFKVAEGAVTSLAFCENGQLIAAGTTRNVIHLWDVSTARELARFQGHTGTVSSLAWIPERSLLASGSFDTTVRFWRLPPGTTISERFPTAQGDILRQ